MPSARRWGRRCRRSRSSSCRRAGRDSLPLPNKAIHKAAITTREHAHAHGHAAPRRGSRSIPHKARPDRRPAAAIRSETASAKRVEIRGDIARFSFGHRHGRHGRPGHQRRRIAKEGGPAPPAGSAGVPRSGPGRRNRRARDPPCLRARRFREWRGSCRSRPAPSPCGPARHPPAAWSGARRAAACTRSAGRSAGGRREYRSGCPLPPTALQKRFRHRNHPV